MEVWKTPSLAVLVIWTTGIAVAQISPGPLSRAHQSLEGVTQCVSCHNFRAGARALKCLECHVEIQRRVTAHTGFHSRVFKSSADQQDCARCHMEHNGQKFPLVRLDRKAFNHAVDTGFALEGKHKAQTCEACHTVKKIPAAARAEIKVKDVSHSFLGLRRECLACHEDQHKGQLGADCLKCHTQDAWKPVAGFNHSQTHFPLTGQHQGVACAKCHVSQQFKGVAFAGCQNCHKDPHQGAFQEAKFRGGCDSCHNTGGWRKAKPLAAGFSHEQTKFPLAGKHVEVTCGKCHKDSNFHRPVAHERCQSCHEDPHNKQFAARSSDCSACHNDKGFKPTLFDRVAHQRAAFPLMAKHATLECAKCHKPEGRATVYITRTLNCAECHADPHAGQFAALKNKCDSCHTQEAFRPATFDVARHQQTHFPLTGKHAKVDCGGCHKPLTVDSPAVAAKPMLAVSNAPQARREYHFASQACASCHKDPHETKLTCETCHTTQDWKQPLAYNHSQTNFKLDGAHEKPACAKCHLPTQDAIPRFAKTATECGSCHQRDEVHGGQFRTSDRVEDCSACHVPTVWKTVEFNHDLSHFPLDRAHRNVACAKCHKEQAMPDAKKFRVYRDTPTECVKCH